MTDENSGIKPDQEWMDHFGQVADKAFRSADTTTNYRLRPIDHVILAEIDLLLEEQCQNLDTKAKAILDSLLTSSVGERPSIQLGYASIIKKRLSEHEEGDDEIPPTKLAAYRTYLTLFESGMIKSSEDFE